MRELTCPTWWYQHANFKLAPYWAECTNGRFSQCKHFCRKEMCWEKWDKEHPDLAPKITELQILWFPKQNLHGYWVYGEVCGNCYADNMGVWKCQMFPSHSLGDGQEKDIYSARFAVEQRIKIYLYGQMQKGK